MKAIFLFFISLIVVSSGQAQENLLDLLGEDNTPDYTQATFKTNRIINLHSVEHTAGGVLDFKISHRFGFVNEGIDEFFGLDQALVRLGLDYGLSDNFTIGLGRSTFQKTVDGYLKFRFLRQQKGVKNIPISASAVAGMAWRTADFPDERSRDYTFDHRLSYVYQVLLARKFSPSFSFQIVPSLVHYNFVENTDLAHDILSIGFGGRMKLTNRTSINLEYIYVPEDQIEDTYTNSFSIGFDIETGGHVFQLHLTNSTPMNESGFITRTTGDWGDGDIHFGFNISRVFTLAHKDGGKKEQW